MSVAIGSVLGAAALNAAVVACAVYAFVLATVKKLPPTFVQAGPMDPWALMQKALLDALVL